MGDSEPRPLIARGGGQVALQTMCRALTLGWKFASSLQKKGFSEYLPGSNFDKIDEVALVLVVA